MSITINKARKLKPEELKWHCTKDQFDFESTKELDPLDNIVGQPRAIEAIKIGAELRAKGYNMFVTGLSGTGRLTTVKRLLEKVATSCPVTYDFCYVNNFTNPDAPRLLKLQKGKGLAFSDLMEDAIAYLRRRLQKLFEEDSYQSTRRKIVEQYQERERDILGKFDEKIKPHGFIRGQIENEQGMIQPEIFPLVENKPVQIDVIDELVTKGEMEAKTAAEIKDLWIKFHNEIFELARTGMKLMKEFRKALSKNDKSSAEIVVNSAFEDILDDFQTDKVKVYIKEVKNFILNHLNIFVPSNDPNSQTPNPEQDKINAQQFQLFAVNVVLDNSDTVSAPLICETTPSYTNLFGTIEKMVDARGYWRTDFTKIKAGSLLKADQGFLIVNANDIFSEPGVWTALKRVLLYDKLEIQTIDTYFQTSQAHLKPEHIDVNVKVIIIGGQTLYQKLYHYEKGFKKIFKVCAQFDYETERTDDMVHNVSRFIAKICADENLPPCMPCGVAKIVEWAVTQAGSQERITLKFSDIADILRESAFYARGSSEYKIDEEDVKRAISSRRMRNDLIDEKIKNQIFKGNLLIDTTGSRVGQINGLTVYNDGIYSFGKPARITATIGVGTAGLINIEREADMSGSIHNKGMLIITGFLRDHFAKTKPLSLSAAIAFEQSYGGVDGDSASAAEIYVLLSELTDTPINQSIAITGSMNQKGDIQPIGGVNQKIRGFFEICRERGFTGDQAVIIPEQNVKDLMLCEEIIDAVKAKQFNIYSIARIEEGIPLVMGIEAGESKKEGQFTNNSLFSKVRTRLDELHALTKNPVQKKKKKSKRDKKKKIEK